MSAVEFKGAAETIIALGGMNLVADVSGALYEPDTRTLIVADLHFEKGSALWRRGMTLPPFDTRDALDRLVHVARRFVPRQIVSLGDGFHDRAARARLSADDEARLIALGRSADLVWVAGNHDPEPVDGLPGTSVQELALAKIMLRHEPGGAGDFEIAGHLHPAAKVKGRGRAVRRRCFIHDGRRCIMPAFSAYAGGLNIYDAAFAPLFAPASWQVHVLGRDRLFAVAPGLLVPD